MTQSPFQSCPLIKKKMPCQVQFCFQSYKHFLFLWIIMVTYFNLWHIKDRRTQALWWGNSDWIWMLVTMVHYYHDKLLTHYPLPWFNLKRRFGDIFHSHRNVVLITIGTMGNVQEVCHCNDIQSLTVQTIGIRTEQVSYFVCFECNKSPDDYNLHEQSQLEKF
jgi:hypothetical protein